MSECILFVDDDPNTLLTYQRGLRNKFEVEVAIGAGEALALIGAGRSYAVIVADMHMPGMSGTEFLERTREIAPDAVRIMLTGTVSPSTAVEAINRGSVYRFLAKPLPSDMLALALEEALKQYRLIMAERQLLEETLAGSIKVLVDMLALVEPASFAMGERIRDYMRTFIAARRPADSWVLEIAALLSQIRFIAIPGVVAEKIRKGTSLLPGESEMLARATGASHDLINNIPRLRPVAEIVLYQQKNQDGTGFPQDAISGGDIPYGARLLKIVTEVVTWESNGYSALEALVHMRKSPEQFDAALVGEVVDCFKIEVIDLPAPARERREIALSELATGQRLLANILTPAGLVVVAGGSEVTRLLLERIRNFASVQQLIEPFVIEA
jgi:response regulator RpfG family c-di-GMP phosphodiesterase